MSRKLVVSKHARKRWAERMGKRAGNIESEFKLSRKLSNSALRQMGISIIKGRRYHLNYLCIFVVEPVHNVLVTVLPRN